jgi:hypothetical protein
MKTANTDRRFSFSFSFLLVLFPFWPSSADLPLTASAKQKGERDDRANLIHLINKKKNGGQQG